MEFSFDAIIAFVEFICNGFRGVYDFLTLTIGQCFDYLFGWIPLIGDDISEFVNNLFSGIIINGISLENISVLVIMCGYGLFFYVIYQFCAWILNLIT